jgi:hypothetical protein
MWVRRSWKTFVTESTRHVRLVDIWAGGSRKRSVPLHELDDALDALVFIHLAERLDYPVLMPFLKKRFPRASDLAKAGT